MENRTAEFCLLHLLVLQKPANLGFCLLRIDIVEPVGFRRLTLTYLNLNAVAVVKDITYRLHFAVHACSNAVASHLGMHFKSKIKDSRAHRQLFYLTLRRYDIHLIGFASLSGTFVVQRIEIRLVCSFKNTSDLVKPLVSRLMLVVMAFI